MVGKKKSDSAPLDNDEKFEELAKASKSKTAEELLEYQNTLRCYPTGCFSLDMGFGCLDPITGLPGVRARDKVECFGPYKSLKTALLESLTINVLNSDPSARVVLILPEAGDIERLAVRGADVRRIQVLGYYDPDIEQHWRNAETVLATGVQFAKLPNVKLLGLDSWAGLTLQSDIEDKEGSQIDYEKAGKVGSHAQLCQRFIKDFNQNNHSAVLWTTNQIRDFIPTSKFNMFEDKMRQKTPGGNALRHAMDWRVECYSRKHEAGKEHSFLKHKLADGLDFCWRMIKEKKARKFADKKGQNTFWFDPPGFDEIEGVLPFAEFFGRIERSGTSHFTVNEQKFHGKEALFHYLESNPEYIEILKKEVAQLNQDESYYAGAARPSAKLV